MLSKEEIENAKKRLQRRYDKAEDYKIDQVFLTEDIHAIGIFLKYIQQLESEKQNLIEKLEKDAEKFHIENEDDSLQDYVKEILSVLKGETDDK